MGAEYLANVGLQDFVYVIIGMGIVLVPSIIGGLVAGWFVHKKTKRKES